MRKDVADMWVSALRSGEYAQTTQFLRKGGGFCCLGVLCDLHQRRTNAGEWKDHEDGLEAVQDREYKQRRQPYMPAQRRVRVGRLFRRSLRCGGWPAPCRAE